MNYGISGGQSGIDVVPVFSRFASRSFALSCSLYNFPLNGLFFHSDGFLRTSSVNLIHRIQIEQNHHPRNSAFPNLSPTYFNSPLQEVPGISKQCTGPWQRFVQEKSIESDVFHSHSHMDGRGPGLSMENRPYCQLMPISIRPMLSPIAISYSYRTGQAMAVVAVKLHSSLGDLSKISPKIGFSRLTMANVVTCASDCDGNSHGLVFLYFSVYPPGSAAFGRRTWTGKHHRMEQRGW